MNSGALLLFLAVMFASGCGTTRQDQGVVGCGSLERHHTEADMGVARFRVTTLLRGTLQAKAIDVVYRAKTQDTALPERALLVLTDPILPDTWHAVGQDFRRGILSDTPAHREEIASVSIARLIDNPRSQWLPEQQAKLIIKDYLRTSGYDLEHLQMRLRRDHFGWNGTLAFPDEEGRISIGGESYIGVTDRGEILYHDLGM